MNLVKFNKTIQNIFFCVIIFIVFVPFLQAQNSPQDEQIKEAQIKNQEAQANYYNKQAENAGSLLIAYSAPITTIVGILIAVITVSLSSRNARKLETEKAERTRDDERQKWERARNEDKEKWEQTRKDELEKWDRTRKDELEKWNRLREDEKEKRHQARKDEVSREARLAAADLMKKVAVAAHSMTWASWVARNDVEHFTVKLIREHDKIMKSLYSELVAAQVVLASFNKPLYQKTRGMVDSIYYYDEQFAFLGKVIDEAEKGSNYDSFCEKVKKLGEFWDEIYEFSIKLPNQFADLLDVKEDSQTSQKVEKKN